MARPVPYQLCRTAVCQHGLRLPGDDSRDQRPGELPLLQLEQQPPSHSATLLQTPMLAGSALTAKYFTPLLNFAC